MKELQITISPSLSHIHTHAKINPETAPLRFTPRDSWRLACCQELAVTLRFLLLSDFQRLRNVLPVAQEMRSERVPPLPLLRFGLSAKMLSHGMKNLCLTSFSTRDREVQRWSGLKENGWKKCLECHHDSLFLCSER